MSALSGGIFTGLFTRLERSLSLSLCLRPSIAQITLQAKTFSHLLLPSFLSFFLSYAEKDIARLSPLATPLQSSAFSPGEGNAAEGE